MDLEKATDNLKKGTEKVGGFIKDNAGTILMVGGGIFLLFALSRNKSNSTVDGLEPAAGQSGYPSVDKNADVIISSIQDALAYHDQTTQDSFNDLNDIIKGNQDTNNGRFDQIMDGMSDLGSSLGDKITSGKNDIIDSIEKNKPTSPPPSSGGSSNSSSGNGYYSWVSWGDSNRSIVDALKGAGEDSSMSNRTRIAEANGISNYYGSYSQNVQLLGMLKSGQLKRV